MMHTRRTLTDQLARMGLKPTDAVMIHSSMKAIGPVEGGAEAVLDALMDYFAPGLLMLPTHTWAQMGPEHDLFDPALEPSCVGLLTNLFMKRPGVVRSLHPTHSIAAWGKGAAEYVQGEENLSTPCDPRGCWGRLREVGAKVLLAGVSHVRNTYIHSVEESLGVPERLTPEPASFRIRMPDGEIRPVRVHRHYNPYEPHISMRYDKLHSAYFETGAAVRGMLGNAPCILCDCDGLFRTTEKVLAHCLNAFIDVEQIPQDWWK